MGALAITLLGWVLAACSSSSTAAGGGGSSDAAPPAFGDTTVVGGATDSGNLEDGLGGHKDAGILPDAGSDAAAGDAAGDAGEEPSCVGYPLEFGCPCKGHDDCLSGLCVKGATGFVCSQTCTDSCPEGWNCVLTNVFGADLQSVCTPDLGPQCRPCLSDSTCPEEGFACVVVEGGGTFCAQACETNGDCPDGHTCKLVAGASGGSDSTRCIPDEGACCAPKNEGVVVPCTRGNQYGKCEGERVCHTADGGWTECSAPEPQADVCDGEDNDCDGVTDEGVTETCNGVDDDCDGDTDEGFSDLDDDGIADCVDDDRDGDGALNDEDNCPDVPNEDQSDIDGDGLGDACDDDMDGDGVLNAQDCDPTNPKAYPGGTEVCDGADNDCNGNTDEGTCDDGELCTDDACDPQAGCSNTPNSLPCDDGDACTENDGCKDGSCAGDPVLTCDDGNPCTDDLCDPVIGCSYPPNDLPCDDGNACTQDDQCQGSACIGGLPPVCDDGNDCTTDACDPATGCTFKPNSLPCDDGDACTTGDKCIDGTCTGGPPLPCSDGEVCTDDGCDAQQGCVFTPIDGPCDDGDACTTDDHCDAGTCVGGAPLQCDDGIACTVDQCVSGAGCLSTPDDTLCDDDWACTIDVCNPSVSSNPDGCSHLPDPLHNPCDVLCALSGSAGEQVTCWIQVARMEGTCFATSLGIDGLDFDKSRAQAVFVDAGEICNPTDPTQCAPVTYDQLGSGQSSVLYPSGHSIAANPPEVASWNDSAVSPSLVVFHPSNPAQPLTDAVASALPSKGGTITGEPRFFGIVFELSEDVPADDPVLVTASQLILSYTWAADMPWVIDEDVIVTQGVSDQGDPQGVCTSTNPP